MAENSRFRVDDRVNVSISECGATVPGTILSIEKNEEGDTADIMFLVKYDVKLDEKDEGFHSIDELRLIHGEKDKAPDTLDPPQQDLPSYDDYRAKIAARLNTLFDALYCKSDTEEDWVHHVTVKGQYLLQLQMKGMSLLDISQVYAEIQGQIFGLMISGNAPDLLDSYRSLSREILHACLCEGCYMNVDGRGAERFRRMMGFWEDDDEG